MYITAYNHQGRATFMDNESETEEPNCAQRTLDIVLNTVIFIPLLIFWWASTWQLIDSYVYPSSIVTSSYITLGVGCVMCLLGHVMQPLLGLNSEVGTFKYQIVLWVFVYVYSITYLCFFRGIFNLSDVVFNVFTGYEKDIALFITFAVTMLMLEVFRTTGSPFEISIDSHHSFYQPALLFDTPVRIVLYMLSIKAFSHTQ
jgi:hypothetical protein